MSCFVQYCTVQTSIFRNSVRSCVNTRKGCSPIPPPPPSLIMWYQRYIEITYDPHLFSLAHRIFWPVLRETLTQYIAFNRGGRGESLLVYSVVLQPCMTSCIDPSVRIVTKSPKVRVEPLLKFSISHVWYQIRKHTFEDDRKLILVPPWLDPSDSPLWQFAKN